MRQADIDRLSVPYPDAHEERPDPADAIGLDVPHWKSLESEIVGDLTMETPYGIGWWAPHPGTSRRILISDQLYCCANSVLTNLVEASLHWLEYIDYAERESNRALPGRSSA